MNNTTVMKLAIPLEGYKRFICAIIPLPESPLNPIRAYRDRQINSHRSSIPGRR